MNALREKIIGAIRQYCDFSADSAADAVLAVLREQEPVGEMRRIEIPSNTMNAQYVVDPEVYDCLPEGTKLYALPIPPAEPVVPEGWALVPVEPTPEMIRAACWRDCKSMREDYTALIAAAPKPGDKI